MLGIFVAWLGISLSGADFANLERADLDIFREKSTKSLVFVGRPTKITDGDTIVLADAIKIRLNGIDAPEARQQCLDENGTEYQCGEIATGHLTQIIGAGRLRCKMHEHDRYGRYIMTCYKMDGTDIQAQMVRDGYAVISPYEPDLYRPQENDARDNKRGLWCGQFRHPQCWRHHKKQNPKFQNLCNGNKFYSAPLSNN